MKALVLSILALASCQTPPTSFGPGEGPFTVAPVIGHWNAEGPVSGHLWIEENGRFSSSLPASRLSAGGWSYSTPWLTLDDDVTGEHPFTTVIADGKLTLSSPPDQMYMLDLQP